MGRQRRCVLSSSFTYIMGALCHKVLVMPYFNDNGTEFDPDLIPKPPLCLACAKHDRDDEMDHILCNLTRADQEDEEEFVCYAFMPKDMAIFMSNRKVNFLD